MTCDTHTTANVTAAEFGFNPLLSGSFLKRRDSCECTICSLFRNITPAVSSRPGQRHRHTDCHSHSRSFLFNFTFSCFILASWPTAAQARWTCRTWCPLVLYFGDRGSLLPYFDTFQTAPISFIFQTQRYCQYAQPPPCVYVCV